MRAVLVAVLAVGLIALSAFLAVGARIGYDCALAGWHPDYPQAVKEACRAPR